MQYFSPARLGRWLFALLFTLFVLTAASAQDGNQRLPVPAADALENADKLIREIFQEDLDAAKDAAARTRLAEQLLKEGRELRDNPAVRFLLYRRAAELAAQAGDAALTLQATEAATREFDLPVLQTKAIILDLVAHHLADKAAARSLTDTCLTLLAEAIDQDNYPAAHALGAVALKAVKKSGSSSLAFSVQKRVEDVAPSRRASPKCRRSSTVSSRTPRTRRPTSNWANTSRCSNTSGTAACPTWPAGPTRTSGLRPGRTSASRRTGRASWRSRTAGGIWPPTKKGLWPRV